jgi:hypothetical protein
MKENQKGTKAVKKEKGGKGKARGCCTKPINKQKR